MRERRSKRLAIFGMLTWVALGHAVALSDFSPQITNLPPLCNQAYTTTIPGCRVNDFTNSAHTCSSACLNGLVQINALVNNDCADVDVEETSIVGLFLLGKAIQLLCNVAVVTTTTGLNTPTAASLTSPLASSTMTLSSMSPVSSGMITDTSRMPPSTTSSIPHSSSTTQTSTSDGLIGNTRSSTSSTRSTTKSAGPSSSLSPAAQESQKGGNVGSGGGSPFDNINNSGAVGIHDTGSLIGGILVAIMLGGFLTLG